MVSANYRLLVDWNNDGDFEDAYDDVSGDSLRINFVRGRDYASQLTGNSIAGKLNAVLTNQTGKYSPNNAASPLSGTIVPGRNVQLQIAASSTFPYSFPFDFSTEAKPLWTGYLESIRQYLETAGYRSTFRGPGGSGRLPQCYRCKDPRLLC